MRRGANHPLYDGNERVGLRRKRQAADPLARWIAILIAEGAAQSRSFPSWGKVRHISRSSCDASPEGVRRISRRPNGTPQPNYYRGSNRGGRTLDTLLKS